MVVHACVPVVVCCWCNVVVASVPRQVHLQCGTSDVMPLGGVTLVMYLQGIVALM